MPSSCSLRLVLLVACCGLGRSSSFAADELDPRDLVGDAKVGLRDAIASALVARPGRAVEAELDGEVSGDKLTIAFEVKVVTDTRELHEVRIDAKTGAVLENKKDESAEAGQELHTFRSALRHTELSLSDLIAKAQDILKGTAVAAALDLEGGPVCEVRFVTAGGKDLAEVSLEGRAGHLVALELDAEEAATDEPSGSAANGDRAETEPGEANAETDDENAEDDESAGADHAPAKHGVGVAPAAAPSGAQSPLNASPSNATDAEFTQAFTESDGDLGPTGTNPYFVLEPGYVLVLEGAEDEGKVTITITVLNETKKIGGIDARVVEEREDVDGKVHEITRDYFAISKRTNNVYYLGEDVDVYRDGKVVGHGGSWLHGENGAHYGLMMPGVPLLGARYQQETAPGVAMDRAQVVSLKATFDCAAGKFQNVLVTAESTPLEKGDELKHYGRGVGLLQDGACRLLKYGKP